MDGKYINIKQPKNNGSYFFNYKGTFSIVLLALVDANYKFIYVDIGCNGRISDGGVFRNSSLSTAIDENILNIPPARKVGASVLPYVIVADDAFPLKQNLVNLIHCVIFPWKAELQTTEFPVLEESLKMLLVSWQTDFAYF